MSPAIARIIADPNRDLLGIMSNGMVITRRVQDPGSSALPGANARGGPNAAGPDQAGQSNPTGPSEGGPNGTNRFEHQLSDQEKEVLEELKARDREVRQHEQKHMAAAGSLAKSGPQYDYIIGPDGKPYATGGRVRIDTSPVPGDPEATAAKAEQIRRAATAPGDPSGPDMKAARDADSLLATASKHYRLNSLDGDESSQSYSLKLWG